MSHRKTASTCLNCHKIFFAAYSSLGKYCCNKCQKKFENRLRIETWKKNEINPINTFGLLKPWARNYLLKKFNYKCCICGWNEINPTTKKSPLDVDHIDGNHQNNLITNLRILCPNCHSLTATYKNSNKGHGRKTRKKTF